MEVEAVKDLLLTKEGEIYNFIKVWIVVLASLSYCHTINRLISPKSTFIRLSLTLPVILLFLYLPLKLSTICLGGPTSFYIAWLANFKLLLFAFNQGPLSTHPPLPLPRFISIACLPIKIQTAPSKSSANPDHGNSKTGQRSSLYYAVKILVGATAVQAFEKREEISPKILMLLYCVYLYIGLEFVLAVAGFLAKTCLGLEIEQQFNEPYLATSLQDFWGKRWNLMVTSILRPTVYQPIMSISGRWIERRWVPLPAVIGSFLVSGLMHELIFYYIGRNKPNWKLTFFFVLHGLCVAVEVWVKKCSGNKWKLPALISGSLAVVFLAVTGLWLFMPQLLRFEADVKVWTELEAVVHFAKAIFGTDYLGYNLKFNATKY